MQAKEYEMKLSPTGECWCGCGTATSEKAFFAPGHDKIAEANVVKNEYGSVVDFLDAHGYGPGRKNPRAEDRRQGAMRVKVTYEGGVESYDRDVLRPVPRLIVERDGEYWCVVDVLLSGLTYRLELVDHAGQDGPGRSDVLAHLAVFGARSLEKAIPANVLPHEPTDRVQRIGVGGGPADGVNHVRPLAEFREYLSAAGPPSELVPGGLLHDFELSL